MNLRLWICGLKLRLGFVRGFVFGLMLSLVAIPVLAASVLDDLTDAQGRYIGPSLEDNVLRMDTDKNGFADVFEVRAYLELQHGKGYEKELLDKWEASASGKSCTTPFAKELYSDNTR
jgi:hypothetical protein